MLVHCLLELMAASLLVDMFLRMRRQPVCFFARVVARNGWPRFRTHLVCYSLMKIFLFLSLMVLDCPEREATYIITNGGINDPDKL